MGCPASESALYSPPLNPWSESFFQSGLNNRQRRAAEKGYKIENLPFSKGHLVLTDKKSNCIQAAGNQEKGA